MSTSEWLTADQVADLEEERRRLHSQRARIQERIDEIDRRIVASGESKVRAMRQAESWADSPDPLLTSHSGKTIDARRNEP